MRFERFKNTRQGMLASKPSEETGWRLWVGDRKITYSHRTGGPGTLGRFGGGWEIKLGVDAASLKSLFLLRSVIFNLGVAMLRVEKETAR